MSLSPKLLADPLAFVSAGFLSIPAWYLNHYARLTSRATLKNVELPDEEMAAIHRDALEKLQVLRDGWMPWKAWCLHIGTAAALLATALVLWNSLHEPTVPGASPLAELCLEGRAEEHTNERLAPSRGAIDAQPPVGFLGTDGVAHDRSLDLALITGWCVAPAL